MASLPVEIAEESLPPESSSGDGIVAASLVECSSKAFLSEWSALEAEACEPNPFYTPWGLPTALKAFDQAGSVRILQFRSAGQLLGLIPHKQSGSYYGYPIPHCKGWLHDNAFCGAPLVAKGRETAFWNALLDYLGEDMANGFFLHVEHLDHEGELFRSLEECVAGRRDTAAIVHREERAMLRSDQSSGDYFNASMSGKKRKELRRQHKRLSELGEITFERRADETGLSDWIEGFLTLEAAGWKGRENSALASDALTETLFRDMLAGAAKVGKLERLALRLDGKPIAMLVNFLTPPGAFSFKTTFDEAYARFSPGVLLQRENLDILDNNTIEWTDSCAASDHPMIERIWREKRRMVRVSIGLGGKLRQTAFRQLLRAESGSEMIGQI